jgi:hypothetical protein
MMLMIEVWLLGRDKTQSAGAIAERVAAEERLQTDWRLPGHSQIVALRERWHEAAWRLAKRMPLRLVMSSTLDCHTTGFCFPDRSVLSLRSETSLHIYLIRAQ